MTLNTHKKIESLYLIILFMYKKKEKKGRYICMLNEIQNCQMRSFLHVQVLTVDTYFKCYKDALETRCNHLPFMIIKIKIESFDLVCRPLITNIVKACETSSIN